jgi:DNA-binding MarR family transcriptional regulator
MDRRSRRGRTAADRRSCSVKCGGRLPGLMLRHYIACRRKKGRTLREIARSLDRRPSGVGRIDNGLEKKGVLPLE